MAVPDPIGGVGGDPEMLVLTQELLVEPVDTSED
jgi:hypothetical protein